MAMEEEMARIFHLTLRLFQMSTIKVQLVTILLVLKIGMIECQLEVKQTGF